MILLLRLSLGDITKAYKVNAQCEYDIYYKYYIYEGRRLWGIGREKGLFLKVRS